MEKLAQGVIVLMIGMIGCRITDQILGINFESVGLTAEILHNVLRMFLGLVLAYVMQK